MNLTHMPRELGIPHCDPSQIPSYLAGLASYGVVFMQARLNKKSTPRGWDYYDNLHRKNNTSRLDLLTKWLATGGALFRPASGLWVLDCDDQVTVQIVEEWLKQQGIACPIVETPSGGRHYYFGFRDYVFVQNSSSDDSDQFNDFDGLDLVCIDLLKNHVVRAGGKKWDFKLGPRTAIMLPGSYYLGDRYLPMVPWVSPPTVDPREIEPLIQMFKDFTPFVEYKGDPTKRRFAAKNYLRSAYTRPSISGKRGRKQLAEVTCNLTRYYCQPIYNALAMMMREDSDGMNWNQRCSYADRTPYPWSDDELLEALNQSVDNVPRLGKSMYLRTERKQTAWKKLDYWIQENITPPISNPLPTKLDPWLGTTELYLEFLSMYKFSEDPPFGVNAFSTHLERCGYLIDRKNHLSAVLGVTRMPLPF